MMPAWTKGPTPRQFDCLRAIVAYKTEHDRSPTFQELAVAMGVQSPSTIYSFVERLGRKGYIWREGRQSRTIVILEAGRKVLEEAQ